MEIWICRVESRNFTFEAFGQTADEARDALVTGLEAHLSENPGATREWMEEALEEGEPRMVQTGSAYRDGMEIEASPSKARRR